MDVLRARARDVGRDRGRLRFRALWLFLPLTVLAGVPALLSGCSGDGAPGATGRSTTTRAAVPPAANDLQGDYQKVVKDVLPSAVQIRARGEQPGDRRTVMYMRSGSRKTVDVTWGEQ